jgi:hypothetical protein
LSRTLVMNIVKPKRYTLYIDESGDHQEAKGDKSPRDFFGITGIIIENEEYSSLLQEIDSIKCDIFDANNLSTSVILHREDVIARRGVFVVLHDKKKQIEFDGRMLELYNAPKYKVVTAVIDKHQHWLRYGGLAYDAYDYAFLMILERYVEFLYRRDAVGDVIVESRGRVENESAERIYSRFYYYGSDYRPAFVCQKTLTSRKPKIKNKLANVAGLQLADLLANTSKLSILLGKGVIDDSFTEFETLICNCMEGKYLTKHNSRWVWGYGKIFKG